jgi:hypothetical protein
VQGFERERLRTRAAHHEQLGAPTPLALTAAALLDVFSLLDIVEIAEAADRPAEQVASLYFTLSERFDIDRLLTLITALPQRDRWQSMARSALRSDLRGARRHHLRCARNDKCSRERERDRAGGSLGGAELGGAGAGAHHAGRDRGDRDVGLGRAVRRAASHPHARSFLIEGSPEPEHRSKPVAPT